MKRKLGFVLVGALLLALVGELGARWILGLGDPPLTVRDPEIEYLFAPNQDVRRFGNRVVYNNVSMRSADRWSMAKERPEELRVLVLGDSVINGGALTDHARLATTIAQETLDRPARPVRVGNVSAGSWGPENLLAYVERFGLFDADLAVVVLSTHDLRDVRTFPDDLGPTSRWRGRSRPCGKVSPVTSHLGSVSDCDPRPPLRHRRTPSTGRWQHSKSSSSWPKQTASTWSFCTTRRETSPIRNW